MLKNLYFKPALLSLILLLASPLSMASGESVLEKTNKPDKVIYTAKYKGKLSGFNISMVRQLIQTGDQEYTLESKASNFLASIEEVSKFALHNGEVRAQSYDYQRSIAGRKTRESIDFKWETRLAQYTRSDRPDAATQHKITNGLLDPVLYQLFLQADSALKSDELAYSFVKRKRIENYTFKKLRDETIELAGKKYPSVVLVRESKNKKKSTMIWIVPALDYQIGKIEHISSKGSTYTLILQSYTSAKNDLAEFYQQSAKSNLPTKSEKSTNAL